MAPKERLDQPHVQAGSGPHSSPEIASGGFDLPAPEEIARECQGMSLTTLREVYANRDALTRKQSRGAGMVFRGVSVTMRSLEYGLRE